MSTTSRIRKVEAPHPVVCEELELRQLMSLTIEVRGTDGSSSATVSAVGQVLNLQLIAVIADANNTPTQDGLEDVDGDILSSAAEGHAIAGNLTATNVAPFIANGAAPGTQQDLNGDGNTDIGIPFPVPTNGTTVGMFFAKSSPLQTSADGTIVGNTLHFEIATLTYTVTNLNKGGSTAINFSPYVDRYLPDAAGWLEDDQEADNDDNVFQAGSAFTVSDSALVVPPVAVDDSATATKNTALTINELSNDDRIVALNPASVVVVTNAAHGTTALQADGSILYTPASGYVGADAFTYHVADNDGRVSNTATVNINVVLAPAPNAGAVAATTLRNQAVTINVLADDSSVATLTPGSVLVVTGPADGTAVVNSDGTILYTPHSAFTGTDTFTYTVSDSNDETSNPGTVTVTVSVPVPPVATHDSFTTSEGAPLILDVLSNDTSASAAISPSTVDVDTGVQHGTTAVQTDGTILYTPAPGYIGPDAFTYSVADALGDISNVAVVNLTVTAGVPPVASDAIAYALTGQANTINELKSVVSAATLLPTTAALVIQPTHGAITIDSVAGTFSYTPTAGFVGTDSFTYTVGNVNGDTSNAGTINVYVGTAVSNAKGSTVRSVAFTDTAGGLETVSLNSGIADVYFSGTGTLATAKNGKAAISAQSSLGIADIALSGTGKSSSLSIKGAVKTPVTLGGLTDSSPMGSVSAVSAVLSGTINLNGAGSISASSISNAQITIGTGLPGRLALVAGAVSNSSLNSAVPITSLKVNSWTDTAAQAIIAPSITALSVTGAFDPGLTLTSTGKAVDLGAARITGAVSGGTWQVAGSVGSITAGSVAGSWMPTIAGTLTSLTIKSGGLASVLKVGVLGTLAVNGDLTGNVTAGSVKVIKVTGAISNSTVSTTGSIGTVTAGSMDQSNIRVGVSDTVLVTNAMAATLGAGQISSLNLTGKTGDDFIDSNVLAGKITSVALGAVTADNAGTLFGLATKSISNFSGTFTNGAVHLSHAQLISEEILQLYLTQRSIVFGDFSIAIES